MKKLFAFGAAALLVFGMSSCSKDYTCDCEVFGITTSTPFNDLSKSDAETLQSQCEVGGICTWNEA